MHLVPLMSITTKTLFLLSILVFTGCANSNSVESCSPIQTIALPVANSKMLPGNEWGTISIGSQLKVPFLIGTQYVMESGPLISSLSKDRNLTYRLIDTDEVKFAGSNKSPSRYFTDVFNSPTGLECALAESFRNASGKWRGEFNNFDIYIFSENAGYKAYLISPELDFVTELYTNGLSLDELTLLIQQTYILQ